MKPDIPARDRTDQTRRRAVPAPRRKVGRSSVSPIFLAFITRQSTIPYSPSTVNTRWPVSQRGSSTILKLSIKDGLICMFPKSSSRFKNSFAWDMLSDRKITQVRLTKRKVAIHLKAVCRFSHCRLNTRLRAWAAP